MHAPLWNIKPLTFVGVSFDGENRNPMEMRWVLEKLSECGMKELPTMMNIYMRL